MDSFRGWCVRQKSFGPELYCGTAGVALFLALAAEAADDRLIRKTAEGAARHAASHAKEFPPQQRIAVYSGTLGIAWGLLEIGRVLCNGNWTERAVGFPDGGEAGIPGAGLDGITGHARPVPSSLALAPPFPRPPPL